MKNKLFAIFMTGCLIVSIAGCGNENAVKNTESASSVKKESLVKSEADTAASVNKSSAGSSPVNESSVNEEPEKPDEANKNDGAESNAAGGEPVTEAEYQNLKASEGFEFESNGDGTCTLTKLGSCSDTDIVIPEKSPSGDKISKIAEHAFYGAEDINSIVFAGRTMEVEKKAFQNCELKKLVITGCDLKIGENVFSYADDVKEIYITGSKLEVDDYAFYDSGKKMDVTFKNCTGVIDDKGFQGSKIENLTISDCTFEFGENVFSYCEDLAAVKVKNSSLDIDSYAFYDSGDDMEVSFTDCKLELNSKAFQSGDLKTLNISGSEAKLGENAFSYCEDLTDVVIGANKTEIGEYAFYDCKSLDKISVAAESEDDDLEINIKDNAFQSCAVQNVVIGKGKVKLGDNAFSYCENLKSVEFKGESLKVGRYAFYECPEELVISYKGKNYNGEDIEKVK